MLKDLVHHQPNSVVEWLLFTFLPIIREFEFDLVLTPSAGPTFLPENKRIGFG